MSRSAVPHYHAMGVETAAREAGIACDAAASRRMDDGKTTGPGAFRNKRSGLPALSPFRRRHIDSAPIRCVAILRAARGRFSAQNACGRGSRRSYDRDR